VTLCKIVSGSVSKGGFEEGEFEGDSPTEEAVAQIRLLRTDPVQLRAQEIEEAVEIQIIVQHDPLGVHEIIGQRLRRAACDRPGSLAARRVSVKRSEMILAPT
jgi:hypothetical protein